MRTAKVFAAAAVALLFVAACGSSGNGIGDIFGTNNGGYDIRGTVDSVDLNSHSIYLSNVSSTTANLNTNGSTYGHTARVYYDDRTTVTYQNNTYRPEDLERGDQVTIQAKQSGGELMAQSMAVTYNARGTMASSSSVPYGSVIHGTVRSIDTYNRTISLDRGYGSNLMLTYSTNTPVYYNNRTYSASNLEVGDEVDVRTTDLGGGRMGTQDITVTRSMSGASSSGTYGSNNLATIRGTVRSVDSYNQTITLDSTTWMSGFQGSNSGSSFTVHYDPSARINYNGQLYPLSNLERGDVIDVQMQNTSSSNWFAQSITLVRDVNAR